MSKLKLVIKGNAYPKYFLANAKNEIVKGPISKKEALSKIEAQTPTEYDQMNASQRVAYIQEVTNVEELAKLEDNGWVTVQRALAEQEQKLSEA